MIIMAEHYGEGRRAVIELGHVVINEGMSQISHSHALKAKAGHALRVQLLSRCLQDNQAYKKRRMIKLTGDKPSERAWTRVDC
jgi:hypothetical protein